MLRITLYKNCILNETYQNVISTGVKNNSTVLDLYLNGLQSKQINDIDFAYQETKGTLIFDYKIDSGNIYDYNYMKVECYNDETEILIFKRYCFIQDIRLNNECVYLDYEEDIWSSYSDKIHNTTNSFIRNSRITSFPNKTFSFKKIPISFEGNDNLIFTKLASNVNKIRAIIQVQYYNLSQQGVRTGRTTDYFSMKLGTSNTLQAFITNLTWMIKLQTEQIFLERYNYINDTYTEDKYYFDIGKIYLVPEDFVPQNKIIQNPYTRYFIDLTSQTGNLIELETILSTYEDVVKQYTINANFKNRFVGTFTNIIPLVENGTNHIINILMTKQQDGISFKLNMENTILDITYDFEYLSAINSISGEEAAQIRISHEVEKSNASSGFVKNTLNTTGDIMSSVADLGYYGRFSGTKKNQRKIEKSSGSLLGSVGEFVTNIWDYVDEMKIINANMYQTTKGVFNNNVNISNSYYGVCLFSINSDNDLFVKKSINEIGFEIYDYISNLEDIKLNNPDYFNTNNINYNSIKFDVINLNGSFPRRIAKILNNILEHGVKIWYNENLQEDNVVIL